MQTADNLSSESLVVIKEILETLRPKLRTDVKVMIGHARFYLNITKTIEANHVFNGETFSVEVCERVTSTANRQLAFAMISFEENIGKGHTYHGQDDVLKGLKLIKLKHIGLVAKLRTFFDKYGAYESIEIGTVHNCQKVNFRFEKTEKLIHIELEVDDSKLVSPYLDSSYNIKDDEFTHLKARGLEEGLLEVLDLF